MRPRPNWIGCSPTTRSIRWKRCAKAASGAPPNCSIGNGPNKPRKVTIMPRIERLEQNTPEWLRWRMEGIGSSDAPVIMGEGAFKSRHLLWAIKTGRAREFAGNAAARRGHALERAARTAYERQFGLQMEPLCLIHEQYDWMRASLDGMSFDGSLVLEIKCPLNLR